MATEIKMPQLGLTMTEGIVEKWLKKKGDTVKKGEPLAEITTDKLTNEIEAEVDGVLLEIYAKEGEELPVQALLGVIGALGEQIDSPKGAESIEAPAAAAAVQENAAEKVAALPEKTGTRIRISPLAKKTAADLGVDVSELAGSGPSGRIVQKDVFAAAERVKQVASEMKEPAVQPIPAAAAALVQESEKRVKLSGMRKVVAERMTKSALYIPTVTQNVKIDVTKLVAFRKQLNEDREETFSINDLVLKAVAKALASCKYMLVSLEGEEIVYHNHVNLGMAVALEEGLLVPVIRDADRMGLEELSRTAKDLALRAREGKLNVDEYQGSTFTVSNLGMYQVETFNPIINEPNAAILGVCAIEDELALTDGQVVNRKKMHISLTFDHRLMDGAAAAKFEVAVKELLEHPMEIVL